MKFFKVQKKKEKRESKIKEGEWIVSNLISS